MPVPGHVLLSSDVTLHKHGGPRVGKAWPRNRHGPGKHQTRNGEWEKGKEKPENWNFQTKKKKKKKRTILDFLPHTENKPTTSVLGWTAGISHICRVHNPYMSMILAVESQGC